MRRSRKDGFTLMEVLVALAVFAVIGVLATQILRQMTDFGGHVVERGGLLTEAQRALEIMRRDIEQLAHRPVRDVFGDAGTPIAMGGGQLLEFTRLGWRNPLGEERSDLQRVAYAWDGAELHRVFWRVLDRAPGSEPSRQLLLAGVSEVAFTAVDSDGEEHETWPPTAARDPDEPEPRLAGLRLRITTDEFDVVRLWTTPQRLDFLESRSEDPLADDEDLDGEPPPDDPDADFDDEDF